MSKEAGLQLLNRLAAAGVEFAWHLPSPEGGHTIALSAAEAARLLDDPDAVAADHYGVMKSDFIAWLEASGEVQCTAQTKMNRRCRRIASCEGHPAAWLRAAADNPRCAVHGAEA